MDYLFLECLKILVLYPKFGNLGGVLGLFVSIGWCFYLLIDPRGIAQVVYKRGVSIPLEEHLPIYLFSTLISVLLAALAPPARPCLQPVRSYCPVAPFFDLGSLSVVCSEFYKARYISFLCTNLATCKLGSWESW